jgi:hypothetical protein
MSGIGQPTRIAAIQQFRRARRKARIDKLLSVLKGKQDDLLLFDEVRQTLDLAHPRTEKLKDIPLDAIVGTVDRYHDFNRQFNPLLDSDEERWAKVKGLVETIGLEPIEVYQVGDIYFVIDGNHRVSVARNLEAKTIEAYVKEFRTKVHLDPDDDLEDVILKAEWNELMEDTKLDELCSEVEIQVTMPGRYREIKDHIEVHKYYLGLELDGDIPMDEAAHSWVHNVYLPAVESIREYDLLKDFPGRTEADLYLWIKKHQWELQHEWNREIPIYEVAKDLSHRFSDRFRKRMHRFWHWLRGQK